MDVSKELYVCVIQDGSFRGFSQTRGGRPIMMKLDIVIPYQNKIQKIYKHVINLLSSADIIIFSLEISNFCYIKKYTYRLHFKA